MEQFYNRGTLASPTICPVTPSKIHQLAQATGLPPLLAQVLINRGIQTPEEAKAYLDPDCAIRSGVNQ